MNTYTLPNGACLLRVHSPNLCEGRPCVVHNPLIPYAEDITLHWHDDRGIFERICEHGVGHPAQEQAHFLPPGGMVHGCDGCCR